MDATPEFSLYSSSHMSVGPAFPGGPHINDIDHFDSQPCDHFSSEPSFQQRCELAPTDTFHAGHPETSLLTGAQAAWNPDMALDVFKRDSIFADGHGFYFSDERMCD